MSKLIQVGSDSGTFLIESTISENTGQVVLAGGIEERVGKKFGDLMRVIDPITDSITKSIENLPNKPQSTSVEFGLSITAEGNLFVAKVAGEATLTIRFEWKTE